MNEDKILNKIHTMRIHFCAKHNLRPNIVYIGHETLSKLMSEERQTLNYMIIDFTREPTAFGMKIEEVCKDKYLSVGYVIMDETNI